MAKKWSEIRKKMTPEQRTRVDARVKETLAEMPLHELRRARQLTQQQLADMLHTPQGNISKLERRTDMYVSTLRNFIEALGGSLDIVAHFPDGEVRISQFGSA